MIPTVLSDQTRADATTCHARGATGLGMAPA